MQGGLALAQQPFDDIEDRAALVGFRIQITGVVEIRRREQFIDRAPAIAARAGLPIIRHAPAGIPGQAEYRHRLARQHRFKAQRRRHHINLVHLFDQAERIDRLAQQHGARVILNGGQIAALAARADFRMRFDINDGLRIFRARGGQHGGKGVGVGAAQPNAQVACCLVHYQYAAASGRQIRRQWRRMVVLAQPMLKDQRPGPGDLVGDAGQQIGGRIEQIFQRAGAAAVVIDTDFIDHQRQRRIKIAGAPGAQKAVFQPQQSTAGFPGIPAGAASARLAAPTQPIRVVGMTPGQPGRFYRPAEQCGENGRTPQADIQYGNSEFPVWRHSRRGRGLFRHQLRAESIRSPRLGIGC